MGRAEGGGSSVLLLLPRIFFVASAIAIGTVAFTRTSTPAARLAPEQLKQQQLDKLQLKGGVAGRAANHHAAVTPLQTNMLPQCSIPKRAPGGMDKQFW